MGTNSDRKKRKAQKARLKEKKLDRLARRLITGAHQALTEAMESVRDLVTAGEARCAMILIEELELLVVAISEPGGAMVNTYDISLTDTFPALLQDALTRGISEDELKALIAEHNKTLETAAEHQMIVTYLRWESSSQPALSAIRHAPGRTPDGGSDEASSSTSEPG